MRISDWSSDVCSSDLIFAARVDRQGDGQRTVVNGAGDQRGVAHQRAEPDVAGADDGVARQPDRIGPAAERVAAAVVADLPLDLDLGIGFGGAAFGRSEEHTSELQSLMRISYDVFCLKKKKNKKTA